MSELCTNCEGKGLTDMNVIPKKCAECAGTGKAGYQEPGPELEAQEQEERELEA